MAVITGLLASTFSLPLHAVPQKKQPARQQKLYQVKKTGAVKDPNRQWHISAGFRVGCYWWQPVWQKYTANEIGNGLDNMIVGNALDNTLTGNAGINLLAGGEGIDRLNGGAELDFLEGGAGNDVLADTVGAGYFNGGSGDDSLRGDGAADFYLGGAGNDSINTGTGADVIAFNLGDGQDTIAASIGSDNVLSLGGGIAYADISLRKSGNHLILDLNEFRDKGFSAANVNWSVEDWTVIVTAESL